MNEFDPDGWLGPRETGLADGGALSANPSLTGRQAAFCDSYADLGNAAAAARQAGYAAGSAKVTGSRLLTNANVLARIEALRAVRARARDADRQLLLERLEETWQGAMAAEQFGAAMRTLRLMAELGGLMGTKAREVTDSDDLDSGEPAGPPDIGALVQKARLDLARTRPGPLPPDQRFLVQAFAGTPNLKPPSNGVEPQ
jgi:phage terminase small subunit